MDNGRTEVLASECRDILRCIRCAACLNVCPVYRQASSHAYRSVYPGPDGRGCLPAAGMGDKFAEKADLPKASSLCGACQEVCPVNIPILRQLLLRLRDKAKQEHVSSGRRRWALLGPAQPQPAAWKAALISGKLIGHISTKLVPVPLRAWEQKARLPEWQGGEFRKWLRRQHRKEKSS